MSSCSLAMQTILLVVDQHFSGRVQEAQARILFFGQTKTQMAMKKYP